MTVSQNLGDILARIDAARKAAIQPAPATMLVAVSKTVDEAGIREALLHRGKTEHLLLCGLETPICVYQTAIAALAAGLQVTLLSDALGARRTEDATACLMALRHAGAHVLPSETVFYALLHDVQHPFFKAYTQLVKSHA